MSHEVMSIAGPTGDAAGVEAVLPRDAHSIWSNLGVLHSAREPLRLLKQLARNYGGRIPIRTHAQQRVLLLSEVEHFKHVLVTNSDNYSKNFDGLKPIFGKSMITMDGVLWQRLRALEQPAFHPDAIAGYIPDFLTAISARIDKWSRTPGAAGTIDLCEETWGLAAEMTCKALFDRDMPFNPGLVFNAVKAFTDVTSHECARLRSMNGELVEIGDNEISRTAETWISLPRLILGADPRKGRERTLLRMIEAAAADPSMPEFDGQQVLDEIKQYLWAGTETTALTLAWALYLTARHPEIAERIRREAAAVYGGGEPTAADYPKLSYTRSVIMETMRLYPPIWSLARKAEANDIIGGREVAAGDTIVLCTYVAHHDPRYWDDPDRFDPDRFSADRARSRAPYSYLPFGGGKRACIGGAMSQVENVLALSLLLRHFELDYVGPDPVAINPTVTLSPKGGLPFRVRRRAQISDMQRARSCPGIQPNRASRRLGSCPLRCEIQEERT